MNPKVRNNFAVVAVGALACSLSFAPVAMAAPGDNVDVVAPGTKGTSSRVSGQTRFGTAVAASKALPTVGTTVILSNYLSWSDVLAATPLADNLNAPVLYTYADRLETDTIKELTRLKAAGVTDVTIVGGELAIQNSVVVALKDLGFDVDRVGGQSRYDTAMLLAAETVDYYNGGGSDVAAYRKAIAMFAQDEAAFTAAYAALGVAQKDLTAAIKAYSTADAAVTSAAAALALITNGLVPSAPVANVVVNANGNPVTVTSLTEFNSVLASYKFANADASAISTFVNSAVVQYLAKDVANADTDTWQKLSDSFGAELFTIPLKAGDFTGTVAQITAKIGGDNAASISANKAAITAAKVEASADLAIVQGQYDAYLKAYLASIAANSANDALQPQINAASAKLTAAEKVQVAAGLVVTKAGTAETEAFVKFNAAATNLPSVAAKLAAQLNYDTALNAALVSGTAYPAFLATGLDFPDALAAGPAAADQKGVVLLTNGATMAPATKKYLDSGAAAVTVGGPAAAAYPKASKSFVGQSRYETATKLAAAYFDDVTYIGLASGEVAADAVIGGALLANHDSTLVITRQSLLPVTTSSFLSYSVDNPQLLVFGGQLAISNGVRDAAVDALKN